MAAIKIAVAQAAFGGEPADNLARAEQLTREAAAAGARIVLLPELFERPYFCKTQRAEFLEFALPVDDNPAVLRMREVAAELEVALPVSFYERAGAALFNAAAMIDADGEILGVYRKTHIPDGPGYQEKFYFSPGDCGFRVWQTRYGRVGVGICWDQWFPEAARAMAMMGADILLYPTAIGGEPHREGYDSAAHWRAAMCGHAAANLTPLAAANRVGREQQADAFGNEVAMSFYGESFITDESGAVAADAGRDVDSKIITAEFDFAAIAKERAAWGLFRDRRPEHYGPLLSLGRAAK